MTHRTIFLATAIATAVTVACSDTTGPKQVASDGFSSESFPRSGALHVTKECSQFTRLAGGFCTITSSNLEQIEVGTKVIYAVASGPTVLDSDVILDPPGPGNNIAFGHVVLDLVTRQGVITISGGTGKFQHLHASAVVTFLGRPNWAWDGTYSFSPQD
jgi:hypothetical protein